MELFCVLDAKLRAPGFIVNGDYVMIEDDSGWYVLNLDTREFSRVGGAWYASMPGDVERISDTEQVVLSEEFFEKYRNEQWQEPTAKVTLLEEEFAKDDLDYYTRRNRFIVDELKELFRWRPTIRQLRDCITEAPKLWRVWTPDGEQSFLSRLEPQVVLHKNRYYIFVQLGNGAQEVFRPR